MTSAGNSKFKMTVLFEVFHAFDLVLERITTRYADYLSYMVFINKEHRHFFGGNRNIQFPKVSCVYFRYR